MSSQTRHVAASPWWARLAIVAGVAVALVVLAAGTAMATPVDPDADFSTPFDFMDVADSTDISVWRYMLSIDGGSAANPSAVVWSFLITLAWETYRAYMGFATWLIGWVLDFEWLTSMLSFLQPLEDQMQSLVDQMGLVPLFLTITAFVAGIMFFQGRTATFVYDIVVAALIAAVGTQFLAAPVSTIVGDNGMVTQARDFGLELATGMNEAHDTEANADQMIDSMQVDMIDTLVRQPTQLINFGKVIDVQTSPDCIEAWETGHDNYPGNTVDTIKDNVEECEPDGEALKDYADNPTSSGFLIAGVIGFGGLWVLLLCVVLSLAVMVSVFVTAFTALKLLWDLVWGLLPGPARTSLWKSAVDVLGSLLVLVLSVVFLAVYLQFVRSLFHTTEDDSLLQRVILIAIVEFIGLVLAWKLWRGVKRQKQQMAEAMANTRPGGGKPARIERRDPPNMIGRGVKTYAKARMIGKMAAAAGTGGVGTVAAAGAAHAARKAAGPIVADKTAGALPAGGRGAKPAGSGGSRPGGGSGDGGGPVLTPSERVTVNTEGPVQVDKRTDQRRSSAPSVVGESSAPKAALPSGTASGPVPTGEAGPVPSAGGGTMRRGGKSPEPIVGEIHDGPLPEGTRQVQGRVLPNKDEREAFRTRQAPGTGRAIRVQTATALRGGR